MARKDEPIVGLDIGSTKVCALVCFLSDGAGLEAGGIGVAESRGWRKGLIVNLDATVMAVKKAVEAAEASAGVPVSAAYVGVGGRHVKGVSARGAATVTDRGRGVTREEIRQAIRAAQGVTLPQDRELLHVLPQEFLLDSQDGIRDPIGMVGSRLEADVHLITASALAWQNVVTAVNRAGVEVPESGIVFEPLASAESCLTADEREQGVALVDLGGGSTGLIVYQQGTVRHTAAIPVGGEHFTNDIAVGLRTPIPEAEKMKRSWGQPEGLKAEAAALEVPSVGDRPSRVVNAVRLNEIIEPRALELLELIQAELDRARLSGPLAAGVVLAGGGAKLGGFAALAEQYFELPVRTALPGGIVCAEDWLNDPELVTVAGLAVYGKKMRLLRESRNRGLVGKIWGALRGPVN